MDAFDSRRADELATLLALHEQGSFAAAGRQLERHPTVLSKRLSALEARLGIRLVERSTRQLRFTDEGQRLVAKVREANRLIAEAEQEAAEGAAMVRGRLRLALPAAMGRRWLSGMLADFVLAYPQVTVEAEYADRFVDLIGEGFDAAIRIGGWRTIAWWPGSCAITCASSAHRPSTLLGMARLYSRKNYLFTIACVSVAYVHFLNGD